MKRKIIGQKNYRTLELDLREKDVVLIWQFDKYDSNVILVEREKINNLIDALNPELFQFIKEIKQAFTDKSEGGTELSVLERGMLTRANSLLKNKNK